MTKNKVRQNIYVKRIETKGRETGAGHEVESLEPKQKEKGKLVATGDITEPTETVAGTTGAMYGENKEVAGLQAVSVGNSYQSQPRPNGAQADQASSKPVSSSQKLKKAIIASIIRAILPCTGPSKAFELDLEENVITTPKPKTSSVERTSAETHKPTEKPINNLDKSTPLPPSSPSNNPNDDDDVLLDPTDAGFVPVLPSKLTIPQTPTESTIIVPPTPVTQLLPDDETNGMTSGAVQAPGSTGEEPTSSRLDESEVDDSGEDTEASQSGQATPTGSHGTFSSSGEEDEETMLIRNGGSGIPIGPVCHTLRKVFNKRLTHFSFCRTENHAHFYQKFTPHIKGGNASC
jgi:RNA polymerase II subunit A small phosphatase-like protein